MRIVPRDLATIEKNGVYKKTKNFEILDEFTRSGVKCVEVEGFTHSDARSCVNSLRNSIARFKMHHIIVLTRKGRVYLINETM
jgi:hypothetical protein